MKRAFSVMGLGRFMSWGRDVPCHGAGTFHVMEPGRSMERPY